MTTGVTPGGIRRVPGALAMPGEARSRRDGRDRAVCLRMAQAALEGEVWKWAQVGFSRPLLAAGALCPVPPATKCAGSPLSILGVPVGCSPHPCTSCPSLVLSQSWGGEGSPCLTCCLLPESHLVPRQGAVLCHPTGTERAVASSPLPPPPHFDFWLQRSVLTKWIFVRRQWEHHLANPLRLRRWGCE